jgi:hypothetical protein
MRIIPLKVLSATHKSGLHIRWGGRKSQSLPCVLERDHIFLVQLHRVRRCLPIEADIPELWQQSGDLNEKPGCRYGPSEKLHDFPHLGLLCFSQPLGRQLRQVPASVAAYTTPFLSYFVFVSSRFPSRSFANLIRLWSGSGGDRRGSGFERP